MILWRKKPPLPKNRSTEAEQFLVEQDGQTRLLTTAELERKFSLRYTPQLVFDKPRIFYRLHRKIAKFRRLGLLDLDQLWLGAYFNREIREGYTAPVRLRWIDDRIGWGLFADQDLKKMTYICAYTGLVRRRRRSDRKNAYCFEYAIAPGERTAYNIDGLDQGGLSRFINHSDTPNLASALATVDNICHVILYASRAIEKGEQLSYSYGPDYWKKRTPPQAL